MTRTVAIIQTRMGSTRLPGKVMKDLLGLPMIVRQMNRVKRSSLIDDIVIATTTKPADDVIVKLCSDRGWNCFRGSENDVLDRYYQAACVFDADPVVRITSDCPLIEPETTDLVIREYQKRRPHIDYACNFLPERTYPRGLDTEVFSFDALKESWEDDRNPAYREHVTQYILKNPDRFRIHGVMNDKDYSHMRWTVDTPEDFLLVQKIYGHFGSDDFSWKEALEFIRLHPELLEINRNIQQKVI
ncbi:MAG: glycosyltransferase family protein [Methanoregula sp.]|nr:glycosyltransferase family protein [Methanoregula sp.]